MEALFLTMLNRSITAGWLVLAVVLFRLIFKNAPKWIRSILWLLVALRLVFPFSVESVLSLIPSTDTVPQTILTADTPAVHSGVAYFNSTVNPVLSDVLAPDVAAAVTPAQKLTFIAAVVWLVGVAALLTYAGISFLKLKRKVREAVQLQENIWLCDHIPTPFILGLFRPKIYLPSSMREEDMEYVLLHEQAHLKRLDHIFKPLGFFLLCVYWFNPVLWLGYVLFCRDMELACDEKVLQQRGTEIKKAYSEALVRLSAPRKTIAACPLAFGEAGVKERVKSILNYKKPAFWIILVAFLAILVTAVCFLTDPVREKESDAPRSVASAYGYYYFSGKDSAYLSLMPDSERCSFSFSLLSSYFPVGTYTETDDSIVMTTDDGKDTYTFKKDGKNLIFDADRSSPMPSYSYSSAADAELCVPDGAVFQFAERDPFYMDKTSYDIDGDGVAETCILSYGPTSGLFTFQFTVNENGLKEYENIFRTDACDLSFVMERDKLKVKATAMDDETKTIVYDIAVKDGNIVLANNGNQLEYWGE